MTSLYVRRQINGKRTWQKVGVWNVVKGWWKGSTREPDSWVIQIQVKPGMVYLAKITEEDLMPGNVKKGR